MTSAGTSRLAAAPKIKSGGPTASKTTSGCGGGVFFKRRTSKSAAAAAPAKEITPRGRNQLLRDGTGGMKAGAGPSPKKAAPSKETTPRSAAASVKLHEICYVKGGIGGGGKKLVAKYLLTDGGSGGGGPGGMKQCENLVVSWNAGSPQLFSEKAACVGSQGAVPGADGPSTGAEASASSSASTRGRYSGYRVAKFTGLLKHKRLLKKINKPSSGKPGGQKGKTDKFKSRKKLRAKLI